MRGICTYVYTIPFPRIASNDTSQVSSWQTDTLVPAVRLSDHHETQPLHIMSVRDAISTPPKLIINLPVPPNPQLPGFHTSLWYQSPIGRRRSTLRPKSSAVSSSPSRPATSRLNWS
ncbi:hypothetical protein AWENTII_001425 [Aspergillus wentii]